MSFPYPINVNIPNAPNQPRNDQPGMKTNFNNINGFLGVDHVAPGTNVGGLGAGLHKQVTYFQPNIPAAIVSTTRSVGFTAVASTLGGNAPQSTAVVVDQFYRNQNGIFQNLPIRAWAFVTVGGAGPTSTLTNSFNVASVTRNSLGQYTVVIATNATYSANYGVLVTASPIQTQRPLWCSYTITNVSTFIIYFTTLVGGNVVLTDPPNFTFAVLQV